jgi:hypothetical protein
LLPPRSKKPGKKGTEADWEHYKILSKKHNLSTIFIERNKEIEERDRCNSNGKQDDDQPHPDFGVRPKWRKEPKRNTCRALVGLLRACLLENPELRKRSNILFVDIAPASGIEDWLKRTRKSTEPELRKRSIDDSDD